MDAHSALTLERVCQKLQEASKCVNVSPDELLVLLRRAATLPVDANVLRRTGIGKLINKGWLKQHIDSSVREETNKLIRIWKERVGIDGGRACTQPSSALQPQALNAQEDAARGAESRSAQNSSANAKGESGDPTNEGAERSKRDKVFACEVERILSVQALGPGQWQSILGADTVQMATSRYRKLMLLLHPDKRVQSAESLAGGSDRCKRAMHLVQQSYELFCASTEHAWTQKSSVSASEREGLEFEAFFAQFCNEPSRSKARELLLQKIKLCGAGAMEAASWSRSVEEVLWTVLDASAAYASDKNPARTLELPQHARPTKTQVSSYASAAAEAADSFDVMLMLRLYKGEVRRLASIFKDQTLGRQLLAQVRESSSLIPDIVLIAHNALVPLAKRARTD